MSNFRCRKIILPNRFSGNDLQQFFKNFWFFPDDDTPGSSTGGKMQNNAKKSILLLDIVREPLYNDVLMSIAEER